MKKVAIAVALAALTLTSCATPSRPAPMSEPIEIAHVYVPPSSAQTPEIATAEPVSEQKTEAANLDDQQWGEVRCDLVSQENRDPCMTAHMRLDIAPDRTASTAVSAAAQELEQPRHIQCYASGNYRPIIDTQGVDLDALECDLRDCQEYAAQISPARSAVTNAVAGAIFGALIGLAIGDHGWAARAGAQGGAIGGAMGGAANAGAAQINTVRNCMAGRGYRVLQ